MSGLSWSLDVVISLLKSSTILSRVNSCPRCIRILDKFSAEMFAALKGLSLRPKPARS